MLEKCWYVNARLECEEDRQGVTYRWKLRGDVWNDTLQENKQHTTEIRRRCRVGITMMTANTVYCSTFLGWSKTDRWIRTWNISCQSDRMSAGRREPSIVTQTLDTNGIGILDRWLSTFGLPWCHSAFGPNSHEYLTSRQHQTVIAAMWTQAQSHIILSYVHACVAYVLLHRQSKLFIKYRIAAFVVIYNTTVAVSRYYRITFIIAVSCCSCSMDAKPWRPPDTTRSTASVSSWVQSGSLLRELFTGITPKAGWTTAFFVTLNKQF